MRSARRGRLWAAAALLPALAACAGAANAHDAPSRPLAVGTLRVDAATDKCGVTIYDEKGQRIDAASLLNLKNVAIATFPGGGREAPASIRATWTACRDTTSANAAGTVAAVAGDHTVQVAERIPDSVRNFMRVKGGSLRLKIRLVDHGVLLGWDVERTVPAAGGKPGDGASGVQYHLADGDFREDQVVGGVVVEPGWDNPPSSVDNLAGQTTS